MVDDLSKAPTWIQVLVALALFFFLVLPIVATITIVITGGFQRFAKKAKVSGSAENQLLARLTKLTSLFARVLGFVCLFALFAVWIAFPFYILLSPVVFDILGDLVGGQTSHVASSAVVSISTYTFLELIARRIPSATRLRQDFLVAFPNFQDIPATTFVKGIRLLGTMSLFVSILLRAV